MSGTLTKSGYKDAIKDDIEWLELNAPDNFVRTHIILVLRDSINRLYPESPEMMGTYEGFSVADNAVLATDGGEVLVKILGISRREGKVCFLVGCGLSRVWIESRLFRKIDPWEETKINKMINPSDEYPRPAEDGPVNYYEEFIDEMDRSPFGLISTLALLKAASTALLGQGYDDHGHELVKYAVENLEKCAERAGVILASDEKRG